MTTILEPTTATGWRTDEPRTRGERSTLTRELLVRAHETTDPDLRAELLDRVIVINRCVAQAVATRYRNRGVADDDLEQAGYEGLVKAVHRFDPAVRPDLLTFAVPTIRGEIQRWFRDQSWMVRPPRRIQELQWKLGRGLEHLTGTLGHEPSEAELCQHLDCSAQELDEAVQAFGSFRADSLDRPVGDSEQTTLGTLLPSPDAGDYSAAEARAMLAPAVRKLSERDQRILELRFLEDRSQTEIGQQLGVTQMQVSRLLIRIMHDLRRELTSQRSAAAYG